MAVPQSRSSNTPVDAIAQSLDDLALEPPPSQLLSRQDRRLPDLVRDTRLKTEFQDGLTVHLHTIPDPQHIRRTTVHKVYWQKEKLIGRGGFGSVQLERRLGSCALEQPEVRAVKRIRTVPDKPGYLEYFRELEAIAKFSQALVRLCMPSSSLGCC
jgi:hypothetical protein